MPGHEVSDVVRALSKSVTRVRIDQKVAVNPVHPCHVCLVWQRGQSNLFDHIVFSGRAAIFSHLPGSFHEQFEVAECQLAEFDEDVNLGEFACAETLYVDLLVVRRSSELMGSSLLVKGSDAIGCTVVKAVRLAGAAYVIACDSSERSREMALPVRADEAQPHTSARKYVAYVAINAADHSTALASCLAAMSRGGHIAQIGNLPPEISFSANDFMLRELDYVGAFRADIECNWAVQAICTCHADVCPLINVQLPISQSKAAFDFALDRGRSTKVQLIPG
jgi:L-idonate 5-dehydrogenase